MKLFVSSTTKDLEEVRKRVCEQLLQLDIQPVSMDWYAADGNSPKLFDENKVKECDALVIIAGHFYGSSPPGEMKSFTELEYDVAMASGKPLYPFLASDMFPTLASLREDDTRHKKLQAFRSRLGQDHVARYFDNVDQLKAEVAVAVFHTLRPRVSHHNQPQEKDATRHLEFTLGSILDVINRMASNSFRLKSWSILAVTGLFGLAVFAEKLQIFFLAYLPAIAFWVLDGYFLRQERVYRMLYDAVRRQTSPDSDFSMNAAVYKDQVDSWLGTCLSNTLLIFHGMILAVIVGATIIMFALTS